MKETKNIKKSHKLPEKFKNYSQEISQASYKNLNKYADTYNVILSSEINQIQTEIPEENLKNLEKFTSEQVAAIIEEEYEGNDEKKNLIKLTKSQLDEMISHVEKCDIKNLENENEEDIEMKDFSQNKDNKAYIKNKTKNDEKIQKI